MRSFCESCTAAAAEADDVPAGGASIASLNSNTRANSFSFGNFKKKIICSVHGLFLRFILECHPLEMERPFVIDIFVDVRV